MIKRKVLTLCMALDGEKGILLGMKKRGFGEGKWNGFGGKLHEGESIEAGALREVKEEAGIVPTNMVEVGISEFEFDDKPGEILEVHVFRVDGFKGVPEESEEMRPQWFKLDEIPYETMWVDDRYWLPLLIAGKKFRARFSLANHATLRNRSVEEIQ